jgi:ethanolamine utilization protein EutP (predicted NTPase)
MVDEFELKEDLYTNNLVSPYVTKVSVTKYDTRFSNSRDSEVWLTKLGNESIFLISTAHPKGLYE